MYHLVVVSRVIVYVFFRAHVKTKKEMWITKPEERNDYDTKMDAVRWIHTFQLCTLIVFNIVMLLFRFLYGYGDDIDDIVWWMISVKKSVKYWQ